MSYLLVKLHSPRTRPIFLVFFAVILNVWGCDEMADDHEASSGAHHREDAERLYDSDIAGPQVYAEAAGESSYGNDQTSDDFDEITREPHEGQESHQTDEASQTWQESEAAQRESSLIGVLSVG